MRYFRLSPGLTARLFLFSAVAFLASGAARAATQYVVIQPIDVCCTGGPTSKCTPPGLITSQTGCAPFNNLTKSPDPSMATSTTPIGFVDTTTNVNITRAVWLQAGIDVTFLPLVVNNRVAELNDTTDLTIQVDCSNGTNPCTGTLTSTHFQALSKGTPGQTSGCTSDCSVPLGSATFPGSNAINMFFVNSLLPGQGVAGPLSGFAWLNGNGIAIAMNTFFGGLGATPRFDTLAHEIGHNLNLDHITNGAGALCSGTPSPHGCNVMDAGSIRDLPASTGCTPASTTSASPTGGALYDLDTGLCNAVVMPPPNAIADQLILGNSPTSTQQGQALLSGFMNPIPNVGATAGGGDLSFTVTYPKFIKAGGRAGEFIFALVLALPDGFKFGNNLFTKTGGNAQVFSFERLNGNNGQGNTNCLKPINSGPSIECLEIDFVVNPNPTPPSTCPADPATCYNGTFTANTSISFTSDIIDKNTGLPATLAQLECTNSAPLQCLDLTYVFSDLFATTTFFGAPVNGVSTGNSQRPDATVPATIVDPAKFPSVANLSSPPLTVTGFSQTPCTSTSITCPPLAGGDPGPSAD